MVRANELTATHALRLMRTGDLSVEALAQAGVAWEVVPGVTSAFGVPAAVGIPVTQRGVAASVTVVTGRVGAEDGTVVALGTK